MNVARSYAQALFDVTVEQGGDRTAVFQKLKEEERDFRDLLERSSDAKIILLGMVASHREKELVVEEIAKKAQYSIQFQRFAKLLARKGRLGILAKIFYELERVEVEAQGGTLGQLASADPVSSQDLAGFEKQFSEKLGKKVRFYLNQDPALMAGVRATVEGVSYDGSLKAQLDSLREEFLSESSHF